MIHRLHGLMAAGRIGATVCGVYSNAETTVTEVALPCYYTLHEANEIDWGWRVTVPVTVATGHRTR